MMLDYVVIPQNVRFVARLPLSAVFSNSRHVSGALSSQYTVYPSKANRVYLMRLSLLFLTVLALFFSSNAASSKSKNDPKECEGMVVC